MATLHRGTPLPERSTTYVRVLYAQVNKPISFLSYSSQIHGHMMHWGSKNSYPCVKQFTSCPWCNDGLKTLWYGWLYGSDLLKRGRALLQLTEGAVRNNDYLKSGDEVLRGAKFEVERCVEGKGSFVRAIVKLAYTKFPAESEEPDTLKHLFDFYKLTPFLSRTAFNVEELENEG